jgi:hypothetical protein
VNQAITEKQKALDQLAEEKLKTKRVENQRNIIAAAFLLFIFLVIGIYILKRKLKPP